MQAKGCGETRPGNAGLAMKKATCLKMQRRARSARRTPSPMRWFAWLAGGLLVCGVVLIAVAPTLVTHFIRAHLMSDEFRQEAEVKISTATGGVVRLDPLRWNDDGTVNTREITLENAHGWDIESSGVHATLDFGAIKRKVWSITDAGADEITLRHTQAQPSLPSSQREESETDQDAVANIPSFLRAYLPHTTEVAGADVQSFNLEHGAWKIKGTRMQVGAWRGGQAAVSVKLGGGSLHTPWQPGHLRQPIKLDISRATLRAGREQLQLSDASLRWRGEAEATLRGSRDFDTSAWKLVIDAHDVPLEEFLDTWWQQRLSGKLKGDGEITGDKVGVTTWAANLALVGGVLRDPPVRIDRVPDRAGRRHGDDPVRPALAGGDRAYSFRPDGAGGENDKEERSEAHRRYLSVRLSVSGTAPRGQRGA